MIAFCQYQFPVSSNRVAKLRASQKNSHDCRRDANCFELRGEKFLDKIRKKEGDKGKKTS